VDLFLGLFKCTSDKVVPCPTRLATSVSPPRHEFSHRPIHVGFLVDERCTGTVVSQSTSVYPVAITPVILHTHSSPTLLNLTRQNRSITCLNTYMKAYIYKIYFLLDLERILGSFSHYPTANYFIKNYFHANVINFNSILVYVLSEFGVRRSEHLHTFK
jgi:hypothetical protein